jgi:hypothetical protein
MYFEDSIGISTDERITISINHVLETGLFNNGHIEERTLDPTL